MRASQEHRVLLTGASGTLGWNVLLSLACEPNIKILSILRRPLPKIKNIPTVNTVIVDDFRSPEFSSLFYKFNPTCVIHCAASGMDRPRPPLVDLIWTNVDLSIKICQLVSDIQPCHYIYISSGLAYANQEKALTEDCPLCSIHPYGSTKAAADILVRSAAAELSFPLTILRPFSFTGAHDKGGRLFPYILRQASKQIPAELTDCKQVRDYCSVEDIALGVKQSLLLKDTNDISTQIFNLGSGCSVPLRNMIENIVEELGLDVDIKFGSIEANAFDPRFLVADCSMAKQKLQWEPRQSIAYAVWQLACEQFPELHVCKPNELYSEFVHI